MVAGGLWLALMRTRWRLLGLAPIVLGLTLAPTGRRPDVLIGRAASVVAVRAADGRLSALVGRGSSFELARWLEHAGDARPPAEVARAAAFRCDPHGCTARVGGNPGAQVSPADLIVVGGTTGVHHQRPGVCQGIFEGEVNLIRAASHIADSANGGVRHHCVARRDAQCAKSGSQFVSGIHPTQILQRVGRARNDASTRA